MDFNSLAIIIGKGNSAWVLGKIAANLADGLNELGHKVHISDEINQDDRNILWMTYSAVPLNELDYMEHQNHYVLITHVDDFSKLQKIAEMLNKKFTLIFLSSHTHLQICNALKMDIPLNTLRMGTDLAKNLSQRIKVSMCSNVYPDGRKNENWIVDLAKKYQPDQIEFRLIGRGWEDIVSKLRNAGFQINMFDESQLNLDAYEMTLAAIKWCDIYIYTGWDEGALGSLDAYLLNKRLLISAQGFHLDFCLHEDEFFFSKNDFFAKFEKQRNRLSGEYGSMVNWSWANTSLQMSKILQDTELASYSKVRIKLNSISVNFFFASLRKKLKHWAWQLRK